MLVQALRKNKKLEGEKQQATSRVHTQRAEITTLTQRLLRSENKRRGLKTELRELSDVQEKLTTMQEELNKANKTINDTNVAIQGYAGEVQSLKERLDEYKRYEVVFKHLSKRFVTEHGGAGLSKSYKDRLIELAIVLHDACEETDTNLVKRSRPTTDDDLTRRRTQMEALNRGRRQQKQRRASSSTSTGATGTPGLSLNVPMRGPEPSSSQQPHSPTSLADTLTEPLSPADMHRTMDDSGLFSLERSALPQDMLEELERLEAEEDTREAPSATEDDRMAQLASAASQAPLGSLTVAGHRRSSRVQGKRKRTDQPDIENLVDDDDSDI